VFALLSSLSGYMYVVSVVASCLDVGINMALALSSALLLKDAVASYLRVVNERRRGPTGFLLNWNSRNPVQLITNPSLLPSYISSSVTSPSSAVWYCRGYTRHLLLPLYFVLPRILRVVCGVSTLISQFYSYTLPNILT
jgi:hypothetical protein